MIDPSSSERPASTKRQALLAPALGVVGGAGVIGGMWLPLATLGGLGPVGFFDYNHTRVYACIAAAAVVAVCSVARCFRVVLLAAGGLGGLLVATGIDLYQALHEAMSLEGGELAQLAHQMVAHSALQPGAYLVPVCGLACALAGFLGSTPTRGPSVTSES